ncbi:CDP-diacylglycerol--glycerol-3-phosphate 3-phosphatidyltransferase [Pseudonocardiaceae bacterium YIM PH 21723]|nr:CDP-diacylglycerol--glycerol-3-phosphate 3-phosphatidyltransferase [Pseudonocardiaceae bacterium YIM PH 21723]
MNLPNVLTLSRIVLVPVFAVALLIENGTNPWWRLAAFAIFAIAAVTDRIDGDLARKRGQVTEFGKLMDPIADKALIGAALFGLSWLGELPWWVTAVIVFREAAITIMRLIVLRHGVIAASRGGKAKTVFQVCALALFIFPLYVLIDWAGPVRWTFLVIALLLTVGTGLDYAMQAFRARAARA